MDDMLARTIIETLAKGINPLMIVVLRKKFKKH